MRAHNHSFAIPVDTLKYQVDTIIKTGKVQRPAIGIGTMAGAQARSLGVQRGVLVLDVPKGSTAALAGLRGSFRSADGSVVLGDVITGVDGDQISTEIDLFRAIDKYRPGDAVTLTISRLRAQPDGNVSEEELRIGIKLQAMDAV